MDATHATPAPSAIRCEWPSPPLLREPPASLPPPHNPAAGCVRRDTERILAEVAECIGLFDWMFRGQLIDGFFLPYGRARQLVARIKYYEYRRRQLETEAWYRDGDHKRVLAARRRLVRVIVLRILRRFVKRRAVALYWQEQTQRAVCAPGGAGRAADRDAFESEFA